MFWMCEETKIYLAYHNRVWANQDGTKFVFKDQKVKKKEHGAKITLCTVLFLTF